MRGIRHFSSRPPHYSEHFSEQSPPPFVALVRSQRTCLGVCKIVLRSFAMATRKRTMTKEEAIAYKEGYEAVNALDIEELRSMSDAEKLSQVASLMASVDQMGWREALAAEEEDVRELWVRLKRAYLRD